MKLAKTHLVALVMISIFSLKWISTDSKKNFFSNATGITFNYTKLKLTKERYNLLIRKNDGAKLNTDAIVFQFSYRSQLYPYPTLRAFPKTIKGGDITFGTPRDLEYLNSKPLPDLSVCNEHVTGDMQILVEDLELLKLESNPADKEKYQYFLFTPQFDDSTQHVIFEISVFPATSPDLIPKTRIAKPSPPY